ncbi:hypothetical protein GEMRC1_000139 [Eukaryota sp. GEM-RC1]
MMEDDILSLRAAIAATREYLENLEVASKKILENYHSAMENRVLVEEKELARDVTRQKVHETPVSKQNLEKYHMVMENRLLNEEKELVRDVARQKVHETPTRKKNLQNYHSAMENRAFNEEKDLATDSSRQKVLETPKPVPNTPSVLEARRKAAKRAAERRRKSKMEEEQKQMEREKELQQKAKEREMRIKQYASKEKVRPSSRSGRRMSIDQDQRAPRSVSVDLSRESRNRKGFSLSDAEQSDDERTIFQQIEQRIESR